MQGNEQVRPQAPLPMWVRGTKPTEKTPKRFRGKNKGATKAGKQSNAVFAQADIDASMINPTERRQNLLCWKCHASNDLLIRNCHSNYRLVYKPPCQAQGPCYPCVFTNSTCPSRSLDPHPPWILPMLHPAEHGVLRPKTHFSTLWVEYKSANL